MTTGERRTSPSRVCEICFDEIPPDEPVVRAARQIDVTASNARAGKIDGAVVRCHERCWNTLRLSGAYRRLDDQVG